MRRLFRSFLAFRTNASRTIGREQLENIFPWLRRNEFCTSLVTQQSALIWFPVVRSSRTISRPFRFSCPK